MMVMKNHVVSAFLFGNLIRKFEQIANQKGKLLILFSLPSAHWIVSNIFRKFISCRQSATVNWLPLLLRSCAVTPTDKGALC